MEEETDKYRRFAVCSVTGVSSVWADGAIGRQGRLSEKHSKERKYLSFVENAK